jgi:hypothetical protein
MTDGGVWLLAQSLPTARHHEIVGRRHAVVLGCEVRSKLPLMLLLFVRRGFRPLGDELVLIIKRVFLHHSSVALNLLLLVQKILLAQQLLLGWMLRKI